MNGPSNEIHVPPSPPRVVAISGIVFALLFIAYLDDRPPDGISGPLVSFVGFAVCPCVALRYHRLRLDCADFSVVGAAGQHNIFWSRTFAVDFGRN